MKPLTTVDSAKPNEWVYPYAKITLAREDDPAILGPNLREADRNEIYAIANISPEEGLNISVSVSDVCYTVRDVETDEPLAMFGTSPSGGDDVTMAAVWFLGSDQMFVKNRMSFLRNSKFWVKKLFGEYNILHNLVDARNTIHIRWLKWLKFRFIADVAEFGVEKRTFKQFYKRRDDV